MTITSNAPRLAYHVPANAVTTRLPRVATPTAYPDYFSGAFSEETMADSDMRALLTSRWAEDWDSPEDSKYDL